ncbi:MAG TPA: fluoride efflux transporter CrcB [Anaerolineaceae bacterium]|nr:fluoride efflux transporter CrcB [Anaerolineaceae bacterium]
MDKFLLISAGAVLGANARYWIGTWAAEKWGSAFPYGTLLINLSGSLLLGVFMALTAERAVIDPRIRLLVATGFLGAYTTFSTFTYESVSLLLKGAVVPGLLNALGSTALGLLAVAAGIWIGKSL